MVIQINESGSLLTCFLLFLSVDLEPLLASFLVSLRFLLAFERGLGEGIRLCWLFGFFLLGFSFLFEEVDPEHAEQRFKEDSTPAYFSTAVLTLHLLLPFFGLTVFSQADLQRPFLLFL